MHVVLACRAHQRVVNHVVITYRTHVFYLFLRYFEVFQLQRFYLAAIHVGLKTLDDLIEYIL